MRHHRRQPPQIDPLEAFLKALIVTRATVEEGSWAASHLTKMIATTEALLRDAEREDAAWDVLGPVVRQYEEATGHG